MEAGLKLSFDPEVHGFASQGYVHSTGRDFLVKESSDGGSFNLFEAAINVSNSFSPKTHASVQFLSRDFGDEGNYDVELDFGYVDYRFAPELGFRLGKVRLPLGLYNEFRDIDASRAAIFHNQAIYSEEFRSFLNAYQGVGVYGGLAHAKHSFLNISYNAFWGNTSIPDDFYLNREYEARLPSPGFKLAPDKMMGFHLSWDAPLEGLSLGYSYTLMEAHFGLGIPGLPAMEHALDFKASQSVISLFYQWGDWAFSAERMSFLLDANFVPAYESILSALPPEASLPLRGAFASLSEDVEAWYVQLEYETLVDVFPFISYGEFYANKDNKGSIGSYRKDLTIGFRYDLNEWVYGKIENHFMHGHSAVNTFRQSTKDDDWNLFVARVAVSF